MTIKEIANQLQLSTTTVSNVIHGKTREVSPATIQKVKLFLEQVGYVPNIGARNLAQNRSKIIGLVLKTSSQRYSPLLADPFVSTLLAGVEQEVRGTGYYLMLYLSDNVEEIIEHVSAWNADGLLLAMIGDADWVRIHERYPKPIVCIDGYVTQHLSSFINIGLNDEEAAYEATRYLLDQGHRRIGMVSCRPSLVYEARYQGYIRALRERGLCPDLGDVLLLSPKREGLEESLKRACQRATEYSALFCASDEYALMLMDALEERGVKVPRDLSLVGFDDIRYAHLHRPSLTTMHQDPLEKGQLATRTLIGLLQGQVPADKNLRLKATLVERQSVRPLSAETSRSLS